MVRALLNKEDHGDLRNKGMEDTQKQANTRGNILEGLRDAIMKGRYERKLPEVEQNKEQAADRLRDLVHDLDMQTPPAAPERMDQFLPGRELKRPQELLFAVDDNAAHFYDIEDRAGEYMEPFVERGESVNLPDPDSLLGQKTRNIETPEDLRAWAEDNLQKFHDMETQDIYDAEDTYGDYATQRQAVEDMAERIERGQDIRDAARVPAAIAGAGAGMYGLARLNDKAKQRARKKTSSTNHCADVLSEMLDERAREKTARLEGIQMGLGAGLGALSGSIDPGGTGATVGGAVGGAAMLPAARLAENATYDVLRRAGVKSPLARLILKSLAGFGAMTGTFNAGVAGGEKVENLLRGLKDA